MKRFEKELLLMSDLASFAVLLRVGSNVARSPIMIMDWTSAEDHRAPEISPLERPMEPFIRWKDLSEKGGILIPNYLSQFHC